MKNLVMGVATGYSWHDIEPFVISLRKNCPNADLVLFADGFSSFTLKCLSKYGSIRIQPIPENLESMSIVCARFFMYKNFLDSHTEYERIFITDTRDVIFQEDLFSFYTQYKDFLLCATESELIKNEIVNTSWLVQFFGENEYHKIKNNPIICAGTIYGSRAEMTMLFDNMIKFLKQNTMWGSDQATLNYLIHNKLFPIENFIESSVHSGKIFTLGILQSFKISGEKIVYPNSEVPAVLHQYDRHNSINQIVDRIYREQSLQPNENFTDIHSAIDQTFYLVQRKNWSAATQYFMNYVFFDKPKLKLYCDKFLKLDELIAQKYESDAEMLFLAIQKVLAKNFANISLKQAKNLCELFLKAEKNIQAVNGSFRTYIAKVFRDVINIVYEQEDKRLCLDYFKRFETCNLKFDKDFYFKQAEIYREFGKKDEALKAYEKALNAD